MSTRLCACGQPIAHSKRVLAFGAKHGRDLATWPTRCASCVLDTLFNLFDAVDPPAPLPPAAPATDKRCSGPGCDAVLGKRYYQDVPKVGDLCLDCHQKWTNGEFIA